MLFVQIWFYNILPVHQKRSTLMSANPDLAAFNALQDDLVLGALLLLVAKDVNVPLGVVCAAWD